MSIPTQGILWILTPLRAGHDDLEAIAVRMEQRLREQRVDLAARAGFAARPERLSVTGADVVFITHAVAEFAMTQSTAAAIAERGLLIIVGNDPEAMLRSADLRPVGRIVVMDGVRFIGGGDNAWLRDHAREIGAFLVSHGPELRSGAATNASLDADDEDDE